MGTRKWTRPGLNFGWIITTRLPMEKAMQNQAAML